MPHYHHTIARRRIALYDPGETLLERLTDFADELLANTDIGPRLAFAAAMLKDAGAMIQAETVQPARTNGPRRETVQRCKPSQGIDLISREPVTVKHYRS